MGTKPTPMREIMRGVIPYLGIRDCEKAIEFYKTAFGAIERGERAAMDGVIMNATLEINGGCVMVMDHMNADTDPPAGGNINMTMQLVIGDGDAWWKRAVDAGCTVDHPFQKEFWGDRYGRVIDPFGIHWAFNEPSAENMAIAEKMDAEGRA